MNSAVLQSAGEVTMFGVPLSLLFLYFVWYSFLGWGMESTYCSLKERRIINRGFLRAPLCPIYGVGALIMVLFFRPMMAHPVLLYVTACVVMSAWEYLVGWTLEATTHMKYWDYSNVPLNLNGHICLFVSLWWGIIANVAIRWIHPATVYLFEGCLVPFRWVLAGILFVLVMADAVATIRGLALTTRFMEKAEQARVELAQKQAELAAAGRQMADEARLKANLAAMELRHSQMVELAGRYSRRMRKHYGEVSSERYQKTMAAIREKSSRFYDSLKEKSGISKYL